METLPMITTKEVENRLIEIRGQHVLLDRDVAELYGVQTKHVNQAVKNNPEKFPERFCFELQQSENDDVVKNFDRFSNLRRSTVTPHAFTEGGLYMIATVLKSPIATQTTIAIIDTFLKLKEVSRNILAIQDQAATPEQQKNLIQKTGELINDLIVDDADEVETDSSFEINLVALKFRHSVKRKKKKQ